LTIIFGNDLINTKENKLRIEVRLGCLASIGLDIIATKIFDSS